MPRRSSSSVSSTSGTSESNIVFFAAGGHSHDGSNSSLIDASKYSIFDFDQGFLRTNTERSARQDRNRILFEDTIRSIFREAGVELGENVISAQNIISGTITANEIAANTITTNELATDSIKSLNYIYTSGRYSDSGTFLDLANGEFRTPGLFLEQNGDAYFAGTLEAAGGSLASFKILEEGLLTVGFQSGTTSIVSESGSTSNTYTTTGAVKIFNYGDIFVQSAPTGGPHSGKYHQTEVVGEYMIIQEYSSNNFSSSNSLPNFTFIGSLGTEAGAGNEHKVLVRSDDYYSVTLANDSGSLAGARQINVDQSGSFTRADLQAYGNAGYIDVSYEETYLNKNSSYRGISGYASSSTARFSIFNGSIANPLEVAQLSDFKGGFLRIGAGNSKCLSIYNETNTASIADTFSNNTDKSYIYFFTSGSSNDPGFIMHEIDPSVETNEGVLHLCPSDDNAYGDYVSIHGTNDPDSIKLHTNGQIEGVTTLSATTVNSTNVTATGTVQADYFYSTDDAQIGDNASYLYVDSDSDNRLQLVSNTSSGRPYISFYNRNGSGVLVRKGFIGYASSSNSSGTGININSDIGNISIDPNTTLDIFGNTNVNGNFTASGNVEAENIFLNGTSLRKNNQSEDFTFDVYANKPRIYLWKASAPEATPSAYDNQVITLYNHNNNTSSVIGIGFALANGSGCVLRAWQGNVSTSAYVGGSGTSPGYGSGGDGLDVGNRAGTGYGFMGASAFVVRSSETIKQNIEYLPVQTRTKSIERIKNLKPARWDDLVGAQKSIVDENTGKDIDVIDHICDNEDCGGTFENPCGVYNFHKGRYGFIAEDVAKVFPKAVQVTSDNKAIGIDYAPITFSLVETVQVLLEKIEELEDKISKLSL